MLANVSMAAPPFSAKSPPRAATVQAHPAFDFRTGRLTRMHGSVGRFVAGAPEADVARARRIAFERGARFRPDLVGLPRAAAHAVARLLVDERDGIARRALRVASVLRVAS